MVAIKFDVVAVLVLDQDGVGLAETNRADRFQRCGPSSTYSLDCRARKRIYEDPNISPTTSRLLETYYQHFICIVQL